MLINRINSDLAIVLGNLFIRTVAMISRYFDSRIPEPGKEYNADQELRTTALRAY